jgi:hypothetical protein
VPQIPRCALAHGGPLSCREGERSARLGERSPASTGVQKGERRDIGNTGIVRRRRCCA